MKRKIYLLNFIPLCLLIFVQCAQKQEDVLEIERKVFQKNYFLTEDSTSAQFFLNFDVEFPVRHPDSGVLEKIRTQIFESLHFNSSKSTGNNQDVLIEQGDKMGEEYRENNAASFLNQKELADSTLLFLYDHEYSLKSYFLPEWKGGVSYCVYQYVFSGGAHGLSQLSFTNYNFSTGDLITEGDLFVENSRDTIVSLIKKQLVIDNEDVDTEEDLNELFWTENIGLNGNFYITEEGISYVYNPYEIAPYFMGAIEVNLPFAILKDFLKKNSPLKFMLKKNA